MQIIGIKEEEWGPWILGKDKSDTTEIFCP